MLDAGSPPTLTRRSEQNQLDQGSFRDRLLFVIGFAVSRSRDLLRRIVREHAANDARCNSPSGWFGTSSSRFRARRGRPGAQEATGEGSTPDAGRVDACCSARTRMSRFAAAFRSMCAASSLETELIPFRLKLGSSSSVSPPTRNEAQHR